MDYFIILNTMGKHTPSCSRRFWRQKSEKKVWKKVPKNLVVSFFIRTFAEEIRNNDNI